MRKVILTAISILAMVMIVSINTALAENRHIVFEMGESAQTVAFPMTSKEITTVKTENTSIVKNEVLNSQKTAPRLEAVEMGESGQIVSFLMTPEKMVAEDTDKRRLSEIRRKNYGDNRKTIAYEMAESGMLIEFSKRVVKINSVSIAKIENPQSTN